MNTIAMSCSSAAGYDFIVLYRAARRIDRSDAGFRCLVDSIAEWKEGVRAED